MTRDQFIRHATRGLWGTRKRDAALELRGAIEDKTYRHQLCGLDAADAERAALRDLGSPHAIARDLNRVHTAPSALRATLLLGMVGLLGVQAVAQIPTVQAAPVPVEEACTFDAAKLARFSPEDRARIEAQIRTIGGRAAYEAACRSRRPGAELNTLLKLTDVITALRAAKVDVQSLPGLDAYLQLRLPGQDWQSVNLTGATLALRSSKGTTEAYVYASGLLNLLRGTFKGPLSLTGVTNPTLHVGSARMQLGTPDHPVQASDVVLLSVAEEVLNRMTSAAPGLAKWPMAVSSNDVTATQSGTFLSVGSAAKHFYAVVGSIDGHVEVSVQSTTRARLTLCGCTLNEINLTDDLPTLMKWTKARTTGVMVYALDLTDLHRLDLKPVPVSLLRLETQ